MSIKRIKKLIDSDLEISDIQVYQELLKDFSEEELHEMSEDILFELIVQIMRQLRKKMYKKIDQEVKMIYI